MFGVFMVKKYRIPVEMPRTLVEAIDAYRATQTPRPSRTFLVIQSIVEYLKARGVHIPPVNDDDLDI
jgi:hypothetical protein